MENPYAAPQSEISSPSRALTPLTWKQILFSFQGRIPRRMWWGFSLLIGLSYNAVGFVSMGIHPVTGRWIAMAITLPTYWCLLAVSTKRWHDRNKAAGWNLLQIVIIFSPWVKAFIFRAPNRVLSFVAGICVLWVLIELGCLRGTVGPNQYGEDPT